MRGNLLFYFKSRDPGSLPAGLLVLENVTVKVESQGLDGTFGLLVLSSQNKVLQHLRSCTKEERESWKVAIEAASYSSTRARLESLRNLIAQKREAEPSIRSSVSSGRSLSDPNQPALLLCRFSCEGLPADPRGQPLTVR